jgi:hypothetical protein
MQAQNSWILKITALTVLSVLGTEPSLADDPAKWQWLARRPSGAIERSPALRGRRILSASGVQMVRQYPRH